MISEDDSEDGTRQQLVSNAEGIEMSGRNASSTRCPTNGQTKKGMVLPFQPLSLAFDHVNYFVDMPAVSLFIH